MSDILTNFKRDAEDASKYVNQTSGTVPTRLGSTLTPLPVFDGQVKAQRDTTITAILGYEQDVQATRDGAEQSFQDAIGSLTITAPFDFVQGGTVTARNQAILYPTDGKQYRWDGALPKDVPANSSPDTTGGVDVGAWVDVGQAALRADLQSGSAKIDGTDAKKFNRVNESNFIVNVGVAGDFATINEALRYCMKFKQSTNPIDNEPLKITINLLSGFVMEEQVLIENGCDMSFIEITSDDTTVLINGASITKASSDGYFTVSGVFEQFTPKVFFASRGSKLPVINCSFDGQNNTPGFMYVAYSSWGMIKRGAGVKNCGGVVAMHTSEIQASEAVLRFINGNAISSFRGSLVDFRDGDGDNASFYGAYCGSNSRIEALNARFRNAGNDGLHAYGGSIIHARNVDVSGAGNRGIFAWDGALIATRSPIVDNAASHGIETRNGGRVMATGGSAQNCGENGVYATDGGYVVFTGGQVTGGLQGILADNGGSVQAAGVTVSGTAGSSLRAIGSGSSINAPNSTLSSSTSSTVDARETATINVDGATISDSGNYSIFSIRGATVNANDLITTNCERGALASRLGSINIHDATIVASVGDAIGVNFGGIINANGSTGSLNQAQNTVTNMGIIFK